tara:strand:+ start:4752 stop:5156 length:405 start_codon:yes stop_codon:yes gene_type:complete
VKFKSSTGKYSTVKNASKYLIKWNKPSRSKFQTEVKKILQKIWKNDLVYEEFPLAGSKLRFDFYNHTQSLAVEANGPQHSKFHKFFHNKNRMKFLDQVKRDQNKRFFCEINQIKLVECDYGSDFLSSLSRDLNI